MWGSPVFIAPAAAGARSIPTCVGQPITSKLVASKVKVYPHVCGAASGRGKEGRLAIGLSPRVWGSRIGLGKLLGWFGSIPTCVGQPAFRLSASAGCAVYPHVCGAAIRAVVYRKENLGLSPRVWGSLE